MKERPILFSGEMVRAILAGRKTQTRRIMAAQPIFCEKFGAYALINPSPSYVAIGVNCPDIARYCPHGFTGDRLWVKETVCQHNSFGFPLAQSPQIRPEDGTQIWSYAADEVPHATRKLHSIHMPRWASRITLEITGVRVEKLNDISESDAKAEGCEESDDGSLWISAGGNFALLWNRINGADAWDKNPWVWVIEFKRV